MGLHERLICFFHSCNPETLPFISDEDSLAVLLEGLQPEEIDFSPVLNMAEEYFTHLGVACEDKQHLISLTI